jgi:glycosyltransferase involved in cell wall biosynthesis
MNRLRILFLTNFYRINGSGGEEQSCLHVVEGLAQRGHETLVLTSMHGENNVPVKTDGIDRSLYLEMDLAPWRHSLTFFTKRKSREKHNLQHFERVLEHFKPDIIFIWGMWNLPKSLAAFAEDRCPDKVVYRFATYWPTLPSQNEMYWRTSGRKWFSRLPKRIVSQIALALLSNDTPPTSLKFKRAICVSAATREILIEAGIPVSDARVIYTGLEVDRYLNGGEQQNRNDDHRTLHLLYAGRLAPGKGIEIAIQALKILVFDQGYSRIRLSLAGSSFTQFEIDLRRLVDQSGLADYVSFLGWVEPEEMPTLLHKFDVLLLPSVWQEPLSRILLEGMISGLAVVATNTGGTPEVLVDGENGLLCEPNNPEDLAQKIALLADDPALRVRLAQGGRRTVIEKFTLSRMLDEIEGFLQEGVL